MMISYNVGEGMHSVAEYSVHYNTVHTTANNHQVVYFPTGVG
jgi:hypothetical protein